ncbi:MAG: ABC transporter substrate-binding protein [Candidatus Electrothrix sp. AR3]|nr:ABC transporter substrate-binding protein [Candidatus Electrothrix sp. AR3]
MARIGMVNYINTAPIYEMWKEQVSRPDWIVTEAPPAQLNQLLAEGKLDLGFVSAYEYAVRPQQYRIMADLSISATGPVGSVFLFSSLPPEQLDDKLVLMTKQSDTSVCLLRIILEEFLKIRPQYIRGEVFAPWAGKHEASAVLAIGDEALRLAMEQDKKYPFRIDLGECWHQQTGLPFVFAVCAVREDFLQRERGGAEQIHQTLLACRNQGLARLPDVCKKTSLRIPMSYNACFHYLQSMEYDLGTAKKQALKHFFTLLIDRREADQEALPLRFFQ